MNIKLESKSWEGKTTVEIKIRRKKRKKRSGRVRHEMMRRYEFTSHKQPPPTLSIFKCSHGICTYTYTGSSSSVYNWATGYQCVWNLEELGNMCEEKRSAPQLEHDSTRLDCWVRKREKERHFIGAMEHLHSVRNKYQWKYFAKIFFPLQKSAHKGIFSFYYDRCFYYGYHSLARGKNALSDREKERERDSCEFPWCCCCHSIQFKSVYFLFDHDFIRLPELWWCERCD